MSSVANTRSSSANTRPSSANIRSLGKRHVRPPLRFSEQVSFYPTNFVVPQEPLAAEITSGKEIINDIVSSSYTRTNVKAPLVTFTDTENSTKPISTVSATANENVDIEAANILLTMHESPLYQERLSKYGKICAATGKLCLGCEQDPTDMKWYSQEAWKEWTDAELGCPDGIIEYHQLTVDMSSNVDSWYPEVTDTIVFAEQIYENDNYSVRSRTNDIKRAIFEFDESKDRMVYVAGKSDQYAIVCDAFPNHETGSYCSSPVYLITSTGTIYPIQGSEDPSNGDYNPIISEVVGNLKRTLNGNTDYWNENFYGAY